MGIIENWPYRQNDKRWANDPMWNYDDVDDVWNKYNKHKDIHKNYNYGKLLENYDDTEFKGNTIANEGCLLTSLAMVLNQLHDESWTPKTLNERAQEKLYYTTSGLSMVTLYADLVSDVSEGEVQLCAKEEYLPGYWDEAFASNLDLLRGYRILSPEKRKNLRVMVKTGTYDDTTASHYLLVDPDDQGSCDDNDFYVLDPAMPLKRKGKWKLSQSSEQITGDGRIKKEWKKNKIDFLQLGGVWVFAKWENSESKLLMGSLIEGLVADALTRS